MVSPHLPEQALTCRVHDGQRKRQVKLKRAISGGLLGLVLLNAVLGGAAGLWLCLHAAGDTHLPAANAPLDCCHADAQSAVDDHCDHCEDVSLDGVDLLATRDHDAFTLPVAVFFEIGHTLLPEPQWHTREPAGPTPARAPPHTLSTSLLVAGTIVLRL